MKKSIISRLFILLSLVVITTFGFAQSGYTVIKVYGSINSKKLARNLVSGDQFYDKEVLVFKTNDARAAVVHPEKGRLMITNTLNSNASDVNYVPGLSNIRTRGIITSRLDIENEFKGKYLLLNNARIPINNELFPQSAETFFFVKYKVGEEEINKKFAFSGDTLIIDEKELLLVDGKPVKLAEINPMKLYYFKDLTSELISEFTLLLPDKLVLQKEVANIINTYKTKEHKFVFDEIMAYLTEYYGKPNEADLTNWLFATFKFK